MSDLDSLPRGWAAANLPELADTDGIFLDGDWIESKDQDPNGAVRLIQLADIGDGVYRDRSSRFMTLEKAKKLGCTFLQPGDVLVSRMADPLGRACIFPGDPKRSVTVVDVAIFRKGAAVPIDARWLKNWINSTQLRGWIDQLSSGTTRKRVSRKNLGSINFPIPPLNEQRRIVSKIESLESHREAAQEALEAIPPLLEKFRQSVLAAAFRGDLTREWRAQNPDVEPASVLLERIRTERKARFIEDAAETARAKAEAKARDAGKPWADADDQNVLEKERGKAEKKYKEPEPVDTTGLAKLPEGWCWARVDELSEFVTSGSRGWGKYYADDGALFLRVGNLDRHTVRLDLSKLAFVRPPTGAEGERTRVQPGDVLLSITADVGMVAVAPSGLGEAFINQHVALIRPILPNNPRCLGYSLADPCGLQALVREIQYGATKASLSLIQVRGFPVPLPPLEEQNEIERAVDKLLAMSDAAEASLSEGDALLVSLNQSILAKAFRGELVLQNPNDEPASVLLERIRAERSQTDAQGKSKKKAAGKTTKRAARKASS